MSVLSPPPLSCFPSSPDETVWRRNNGRGAEVGPKQRAVASYKAGAGKGEGAKFSVDLPIVRRSLGVLLFEKKGYGYFGPFCRKFAPNFEDRR